MAADSISVIDETFLLIDLVLSIEKTAAASVDEIIALTKSDFKKGHPVIKEKNAAVMTAVISTPAVARNIAGFATGLK